MKIRNIHLALSASALACIILALGLISTASAQEYGGYDTQSYGTTGSQGTSMLSAMAHLSGSQEVPAVTSSTTGHAEVTRTSGGNLTYSVSVMNGDQITAAHLHCGDPGENGPVVVGLFSHTDGVDVNGSLSSGTISSGAIQGSQCSTTIGYTIATTQQLVQAVIAGDIYVNVHSAAHPNGVARGQLMASSYNSPDPRNDDWHDDAEKHWWNNEWWFKNRDGNWYNERGDTWDGNQNQEGYSNRDHGNDGKKEDRERDEDKRHGDSDTRDNNMNHNDYSYNNREGDKHNDDYTHEKDQKEGRNYDRNDEWKETDGKSGNDGKGDNDKSDRNWDKNRNDTDKDSKRDNDDNHKSNGRDNNSVRDWIASSIVERMEMRMSR